MNYNMQMSLFSDNEVVKLSEVVEYLQGIENYKLYKPVKGKYEIWQQKGFCIQINIYKSQSDKESREKIIQQGVYLAEQSDGTYRISFFSNNCLPAQIDYDGGKRYDGGRFGETDTTKFLKWFVNQTTIINDMEKRK